MGNPKLNRTAIEETVRALRDQRRLQAEDEALVTLARRLAVACDAAPGNAALWREYRAAVASLQEVGANDVDPDDAGQFAAEVQSPVGHTS